MFATSGPPTAYELSTSSQFADQPAAAPSRAEIIEDALNAAVLVIQNALGAESGDCAGMYFDGDPRGGDIRRMLGEYYDVEAADRD